MIHQARKFICLLLSALLLCAWVIPAMGADNGADPLTWAEVVAWARSLEMQGRAAKPLNDPHDEAALSEDGYAYVYDFGTLYFDSPELTEDALAIAENMLAAENETAAEVFRLRLEGFSYAEIAERLGISENSARVVCFRVRNRIRKELEKEGYNGK